MSQNFELRYMKRRAITSYGIILFTISNKRDILYQLCQRRDSISYAEFLKNTLSHNVIRMHIDLMSREERKRCIDYYLKNDPESLWNDLWVNHKTRIYKNDMKKCCEAFKKNMEIYMDDFLYEGGGKLENSWGFSKGRKHHTESELDCALREFEEETTIKRDVIQVLKIKPYEEYYTGTDGKLYRTVYYVAYIPYVPELKYKSSIENVRDTYVSEEVSQINWCTYKDSINRLDNHKKEILRDINKTLLFTKKRKPPPRRHTY
jgi:8-oxo-dGTP pyrophosphatase MutT (NUDIX family)